MIISYYAQSQYQKEDFIIGIQTNNVYYQDYTQKQGYGFDFQLFVADNFSFNSNFYFGENYVHVPLGVAAIILAAMSGDCAGCANISISDDYAAIVFFAMLSEGVSFYINIDDNFYISPYLNPLGFDYMFEKNYDIQRFLFTGSAGLKFNYSTGYKFIISPFIECKTIYGHREPGFGFGISLNIAID